MKINNFEDPVLWYDWCAICNKRLDYVGWEATIKGDICNSCINNLAKHNVIIHDVKDLLNWIKTTDAITVRGILKSVNFLKSYWHNVIDDAVIDKGIKFNSNNLIE